MDGATILHVAAGSLTLVAAPAAMFVRKGGAWHRRAGVAFVVTMSIVLLTAGFMWQKLEHTFLLALAIISGFLVFNGCRVIVRRRRGRRDQIDDTVDAGAAALTVASAIWLVYLAETAATPLMRTLVPILCVLATIAVAFALNDVAGIFGPRSRLGWLLSHLSAMIAAYISAVTAFVVINAHDVNMMIRWAVPSAIGVSFITYYSIKTLRKGALARRKAAQVQAARPAASGRFAPRASEIIPTGDRSSGAI